MSEERKGVYALLDQAGQEVWETMRAFEEAYIDEGNSQDGSLLLKVKILSQILGALVAEFDPTSYEQVYDYILEEVENMAAAEQEKKIPLIGEKDLNLAITKPQGNA